METKISTYGTGDSINKIYVSFKLSNVLGLFPLRTDVMLEYYIAGSLFRLPLTTSKDSTITIPKTLIGNETFHRKGVVTIESHIGCGDNVDSLLKQTRFEYKISGGSDGEKVYEDFDKRININSEKGKKIILFKIIDLV